MTPHAHRPDDLSRRPTVSRDDWIALGWLIAIALILLAITAVDPGMRP